MKMKIRMYMATSDFANKMKVGNTWYAQYEKVVDAENTDMVSCSRVAVSLVNEPTTQQCLDSIFSQVNSEIDEKILSGCVWTDADGNSHNVWLSMENQFNFKATFDLALQMGGKTLPVAFKLGTNESPDYVTFASVESLQDFILKTTSYIQETLAEGWKRKNAIEKEFA